MQTPNPVPPAESAQEIKHGYQQILEYCAKNPFVALWNTVLILGGLIAFSHFAGTGYFPDLDMKTATSFLLGIALLGITLVSMLALTMVLPSYLIRSEVWKPYYLHHPSVDGQEARRVSADIEKTRLPPFMLLSFCHGLLAFSFYVFLSSLFIPDAQSGYRYSTRCASVGGFVLSMAMIVLMEYLRRKRRDDASPEARTGHARRAQHLTLAFIWWLLFGAYLLLLLLSVKNLRPDDIAGHLGVLIFAFALIAVNSWLATLRLNSAKSYWKMLATAALLVFLYLSIPSNPLNITRSIFASLAIGELGSSSFVVKRPTCNAVNLIAPGACEGVANDAGCIRPKKLANRIGSEYLLVLEVPMRTQSGTPAPVVMEMKVPIPKSEVLIWGSVDAGSVAWASCNGVDKPGKDGNAAADAHATRASAR